jgi:hypothetical protein
LDLGSLTRISHQLLASGFKSRRRTRENLTLRRNAGKRLWITAGNQQAVCGAFAS